MVLHTCSFSSFDFCIFKAKVSCSSGWLQICCVAQAGLELLILLAPPPKSWGHRCVSPSRVSLVFYQWFHWHFLESHCSVSWSAVRLSRAGQLCLISCNYGCRASDIEVWEEPASSGDSPHGLYTLGFLLSFICVCYYCVYDCVYTCMTWLVCGGSNFPRVQAGLSYFCHALYCTLASLHASGWLFHFSKFQRPNSAHQALTASAFPAQVIWAVPVASFLL